MPLTPSISFTDASSELSNDDIVNSCPVSRNPSASVPVRAISSRRKSSQPAVIILPKSRERSGSIGAKTPAFDELSNEELEYIQTIGAPSQRASAASALADEYAKEEEELLRSQTEGIADQKKRLSCIGVPSKEAIKKFKKRFPALEQSSEDETNLIKVYSCSYDKDGGIANSGKLYLTKTDIAFHGSSFSRSINIAIKTEELSNVSKKSTLGVFQNAIRLTTQEGKDYVFSSFSKRDATYDDLVAVWNIYLANESKLLKRSSVSDFLEPEAEKEKSIKRSRSSSVLKKISAASASAGDILLRKRSGLYRLLNNSGTTTQSSAPGSMSLLDTKSSIGSKSSKSINQSIPDDQRKLESNSEPTSPAGTSVRNRSSTMSGSLDRLKTSTEKLRKRSGTTAAPDSHAPTPQSNTRSQVGSSSDLLGSGEISSVKSASRISDFFRHKQKSVPVTRKSIKSRASLLEGVISDSHRRASSESQDSGSRKTSVGETCGCLFHYAVMLDSVFDITVYEAQDYLFASDADVFKEAMTKYGYTVWIQDDLDRSSRKVTATIQDTDESVIQEQTVIRDSSRKFHVVECVTNQVPSETGPVITTRFCLTTTNLSKTRLLISSKVTSGGELVLTNEVLEANLDKTRLFAKLISGCLEAKIDTAPPIFPLNAEVDPGRRASTLLRSLSKSESDDFKYAEVGVELPPGPPSPPKPSYKELGTKASLEAVDWTYEAVSNFLDAHQKTLITVGEMLFKGLLLGLILTISSYSTTAFLSYAPNLVFTRTANASETLRTGYADFRIDATVELFALEYEGYMNAEIEEINVNLRIIEDVLSGTELRMDRLSGEVDDLRVEIKSERIPYVNILEVSLVDEIDSEKEFLKVEIKNEASVMILSEGESFKYGTAPRTCIKKESLFDEALAQKADDFISDVNPQTREAETVEEEPQIIESSQEVQSSEIFEQVMEAKEPIVADSGLIINTETVAAEVQEETIVADIREPETVEDRSAPLIQVAENITDEAEVFKLLPLKEEADVAKTYEPETRIEDAAPSKDDHIVESAPEKHLKSATDEEITIEMLMKQVEALKSKIKVESNSKESV